MSINVGPLEEGKHKCELSNATDENQFTVFLENQETFTYLAIAQVNLFIVQKRKEFSLGPCSSVGNRAKKKKSASEAS